jgi:PIN domain nuclease of toxin-antitoxin system
MSAASAWEIEIKRALHKLDAPDDLLPAVTATGFASLPITAEHAVEAGRLPLHHSDPFDRVLVAQARLEQLTIVTGDHEIARYDVQTMPAK